METALKPCVPTMLASGLMPEDVEWRVAQGLVPYPVALATMEQRAADIAAGNAPELYWLLEHPPLYTCGTSADISELIDPTRFPVFETGRGGRYTYHGPGQRLVYALSDLRKRDKDVRQHVARLEEWVIRTLKHFGIDGGLREGRIGIWVNNNGREEKIAAIGVRVKQWVTFHGLALNVAPDLSHYKGIVPCGIAEFGVTSMHALGVKATMEEVDAAFLREAEGLVF
jgi:lipoyl(octanoyl) transferase